MSNFTLILVKNIHEKWRNGFEIHHHKKAVPMKSVASLIGEFSKLYHSYSSTKYFSQPCVKPNRYKYTFPLNFPRFLKYFR